MTMSIIAGLFVCAFVYVIRESLMGSPEEDWWKFIIYLSAGRLRQRFFYLLIIGKISLILLC